MNTEFNFRKGVVRPTLLVLAFLALILAMAASSLWHGHTTDSGSPCAICQLGHMPIVGHGVPVLMPSLVFLRWHAPPDELTYGLDHCFSQYPSRAPPA